LRKSLFPVSDPHILCGSDTGFSCCLIRNRGSVEYRWFARERPWICSLFLRVQQTSFIPSEETRHEAMEISPCSGRFVARRPAGCSGRGAEEAGKPDATQAGALTEGARGHCPCGLQDGREARRGVADHQQGGWLEGPQDAGL